MKDLSSYQRYSDDVCMCEKKGLLGIADCEPECWVTSALSPFIRPSPSCQRPFLFSFIVLVLKTRLRLSSTVSPGHLLYASCG